MAEKPRVPRYLGVRGRRAWRDLNANLEFDTHELLLLEELCRALDRIDDLAARVESDGSMIPGSAGQLVLHPAIAELRQQQAIAARLVGAIGIPAGDASTVVRESSSRARAAANARWVKQARAVARG